MHGCDDECGNIHGKNFSTIQNFIMNSRDLTLKQMFDITAKLVGEQEEIHGLDKIHWGKNSWRLVMKQLSIFSVVPRKDPSTSRIQRNLEEKD